jgi:ABC-type glycerol-3-phosphate transport system substrate-binding protein
VIYPIAIATELVAAEAITPLPEEFSQTLDRDQGNLLPALRNRLAAYTDQTIGLPLGTSLPAILSVDPIAPVGSWKDYDQLVADTWKGKAGEPTAPGWAAAMFLWRAAHIKGWLFDRENLNPLIDSEPYVEALERFTTTHDRYQAKRQGPDEIWSGIISGSLLGGISWWHEDNANVEVNVVDLPTPSSQGKILFDPFAVMASLSSDCRQSAAAKQFIAWIAGNESSESMRRNVFGTATNRATSVRESQSALGAKQVTNYDRWLSNRLTNPITRPTLQLQDSTDYYAALDQGVGRALDHQTSAQDALSQTADKWRQITRNVGAVKQLRTWNRLQGLRG